MTTDLLDEVRRVLGAAADEVGVPPIDQVAFRGKVRAARGRRLAARTGVLVGGAGAVAAGVTGVLLATSLFTGSPHAGPATASPPVFVPAGDATPPVVFALRDSIGTAYPGGWGHVEVDLGRYGAESLFRTAEGVALIDGQSGLVRVPVASDGAVGTAQRSNAPIDNIAVSQDGETGAWFELRDDSEVFFVLYSFVDDVELASRPVPPDDAVQSIVAVQGGTAIIQEGRHYSLWSAKAEAVSLDLGSTDYRMQGSWSNGIVAMARSDYSGTDLFELSGADASLVQSVPALGAQVSPEGDNVVGFTEAAEEPALADDKRQAAVWNVATGERVDFTGLPTTIFQVGWLDNDTIAVGGGETTGTWPGALDLFTCELADLTCTKVYTDRSGDEDALPRIAGAISR